ncbi:nicotinamidase [Bartonella sp. TP]|uniref:nicotinamidase n=1 Tax=Bartonella sp. TP TaxID=3057550 RepID=UPI0025B260F0|nr:nicotinamidase [Bartonella sp. TP]MDN5249356.1 nicotinamidase [Alphaproteobacteria bacterium]WJW79748.1 nicotinamidase [Bartonella sp. TP]
MSQKYQALIVIDMQNDFMEDGPLEVPGANEILAPINKLIDRYDNIIFTQDWHPANHHSFTNVSKTGIWPPHCIQGSKGAKINSTLNTNKAQLILRKGYRPNIDSYSAFFENDKATPTGLAAYLQERGLKNLIFCGLATDFCVGYSVLDAIKCGFESTLILSACRAIDNNGSLDIMLTQLKNSNAELLLGA